MGGGEAMCVTPASGVKHLAEIEHFKRPQQQDWQQ